MSSRRIKAKFLTVQWLVVTSIILVGNCGCSKDTRSSNSSTRAEGKMPTQVTSGVAYIGVNQKIALNLNELNEAILLVDELRDAVVDRPAELDVAEEPYRVLKLYDSDKNVQEQLLLFTSSRLVTLTDGETFALNESEVDRLLAFFRQVEQAHEEDTE